MRPREELFQRSVSGKGLLSLKVTVYDLWFEVEKEALWFGDWPPRPHWRALLQFGFDFRALLFSRFCARVFFQIKTKAFLPEHFYLKKKLLMKMILIIKIKHNCIEDRSRFVTMFRFDIFLILHLSRPIEMQKIHRDFHWKWRGSILQWKNDKYNYAVADKNGGKHRGGPTICMLRVFGRRGCEHYLWDWIKLHSSRPAGLARVIFWYLSIPLLWIWTSGNLQTPHLLKTWSSSKFNFSFSF